MSAYPPPGRHYSNCSDWGYDLHPGRNALKERCERLEDVLAGRPRFSDRFGYDTRVGHSYMFQGMAPQGCSCILGKYRGDISCKELAAFNVQIRSDPLVGTHYSKVAEEIAAFESRCAALVRVHALWISGKGASQSARNALLKYVDVLADILDWFLTIHPYMDGNGHSGRLLVFAMMARAGYAPEDWSIDGKKDYGQALADHRRGKPGALRAILLKAIVGEPAAAA